MADSSEAVTDAPVAPGDLLYTVCRVQDGSLVRAELSFDDATSECAILNAQARQPAGQSESGVPIYGSMFHGEVSHYEVRSASGLVI